MGNNSNQKRREKRMRTQYTCGEDSRSTGKLIPAEINGACCVHNVQSGTEKLPLKGTERFDNR